MFGSSILEVIIGVVLVYFITSLLCTTITEWISRLFAMRSRTLKDGVARLFNIIDKEKPDPNAPPDLKTQIYNHPFIRSISSKETSWFFNKPLKEFGPSEIPARTFALALIDIVSNPPKAPPTTVPADKKAAKAAKKSHANAADLAVTKAVEDKVKAAEDKAKAAEDKAKAAEDKLKKTETKASEEAVASAAKEAAFKAADDAIKTGTKTISKAIDDAVVKAAKEAVNAANKTASPSSVDSLKNHIAALDDTVSTKQILTTLLNSAITEVGKDENVLKTFRTSVEKWFDDGMQRVTGWYKRKTQLIVLVLALAICFGFNVDTFGIANTLFKDANLRSSMVAAAEAQVNAPATGNITINNLVKEVTVLNLPVGWSTDNSTAIKAANSRPVTIPGWFVKIFGILVSGFAISLGSGFWFDILSKLVNVRATGKKPATTDDEEAAAAAKKTT